MMGVQIKATAGPNALNSVPPTVKGNRDRAHQREIYLLSLQWREVSKAGAPDRPSRCMRFKVIELETSKIVPHGPLFPSPLVPWSFANL